MNMYKLDEPRISVVSPGDEDGIQREIEVGQSNAWGEALFFFRVCGYRIGLSQWDGSKFGETSYIVPAIR